MIGRGPLAGALVLVALVALCALAPPVLPHDPLSIDATRILQSPSWNHPFGTDSLGRDVLARVLAGGRSSLGAGLVATLVAMTIGAALGALAGARGRSVDGVLSRIADVVLAFPDLVGAIALLGLLHVHALVLPASVRVGFVIALFTWPALFRYVRAEMQRLRASDLALAARAAGARESRVIFVHLLPGALAPALVPGAFVAAGAVLAEAGLGFLGLGIAPPAPSWGNLLREAREYVRTAWWLALFPGLFLYATTLACHAMAEGARRHLASNRRGTRDATA